MTQNASTAYEYWTAIGTVAAVIVALGIALTQAAVALYRSNKQRKLARRKVASLVSAWIEYTYAPSQDGDYYQRKASLHIANESDEPVFKVEVVCGIATEKGPIRLGPLSAPRIIPVLPPKREFEYDITMGVLAFGEYAQDSFRVLFAEIGFRDHENKRWRRDFEGDLHTIDHPTPAVLTEIDDELTAAQAGPLNYPYNPLALIFAFATLAADPETDDEQFRESLIVENHQWAEADSKDITAVRNLLRTGNIASHVWYPAPRVAHIRFVDETPEKAAAEFGQVLVLVWRNTQGWTLFGKGPHLIWTIAFEPHELETDPLDNRPAL